MKIYVLIAMASLAGFPVMAQTARPMLDYSSAAAIRDGCLRWAAAHDRKVAIAILDSRSMEISFAHMDDGKAGIGDAARWKANASARSGRSASDIASLNPPLNMPNIATMAGGVPVYTAGGAFLGGVGVSGGKPEEDAACGAAGVEAAGLKTRMN